MVDKGGYASIPNKKWIADTTYFVPIEQKHLVPESESEFGYFGHHMILAIPSDVVDEEMDKNPIPSFFEIQIKTLFQHAWSEADHDLAYKPGDTSLTADQKRLVALTSAQAWGADRIFDELFHERRTL
jgi:putative GTP pyrophosphokinase